MLIKIPDFKRCCFCVPLRHGILVFGYLNLILTLLVMNLEGLLGYSFTIHTMTMYRRAGFYTRLWFSCLLYSMEIIFNVILLIGAHTKRTRFIKVYYYYGITTILAAYLTFFVVQLENQFQDFEFNILEFCLCFTGFLLHAYLLLLIRTELQKLKVQQRDISFVNQMSDVVPEPLVIEDGRNHL